MASQNRSKIILNTASNGNDAVFWIPVPWHPILKLCKLNAVLREINSLPELRQILLIASGYESDNGQGIEMRVAWSIRTPAFIASIRTINENINING